MMFITGDTHGGIDFMKLRAFAQKYNGLTRDDYVIIAGDFGGVWCKDSLKDDLKKYVRLPFTLLFVDGNHENFDVLSAAPVEMWNGGKIHRVAENVLHLMRGQVFTICGKTFFAFGGAESTDKEYRIEGKSWWAAEIPGSGDYAEAYKNLAAAGNKVDYIVTHTIDEDALRSPQIVQCGRGITATNRALSRFENEVNYGHWYFGHYHIDSEITDRKTAIYQKIIKLT